MEIIIGILIVLQLSTFLILWRYRITDEDMKSKMYRAIYDKEIYINCLINDKIRTYGYLADLVIKASDQGLIEYDNMVVHSESISVKTYTVTGAPGHYNHYNAKEFKVYLMELENQKLKAECDCD